MKTTAIAIGTLLLLSTGCVHVTQLIPHYAVSITGNSSAQATAGIDIVAAYAESGGAVVVSLQETKDGPYVEKWSRKIDPGAGWYRRVVWGKNDSGGWVTLEEISCEEARAVYPWLPKCDRVARVEPSRNEQERLPMYVEERKVGKSD